MASTERGRALARKVASTAKTRTGPGAAEAPKRSSAKGTKARKSRSATSIDDAKKRRTTKSTQAPKKSRRNDEDARAKAASTRARSTHDLEEYRRKRDFSRTPEPAGAHPSSQTGRSFVVQQHAARRMHYDFRLELKDVLLSWAVPKGPSLDPKDRRLAVRTEDHPIEYGTFEGSIPKGEYGGGTVLLWDRGTWMPIGDPRAALEKGHLAFTLEGEKLHGRFNLVRTRGTDQWLLIKGKDEEARPGEGEALVRDARASVASGRTLDEIASDPDRVWHSDEPTALPDPSALDEARRAPLPERFAPELATLVDVPPAGDDWIHEIKLDGYRILARIEGGSACLFTRKGHDWTDRLPSLARVLGELPVRSAWLDGEIVILDAKGRSDFGALQDAFAKGRTDAVRYFVFDLLYLEGFDLTKVALIDRKRTLHTLLARTGALEGRLRFNDHVVGRGEPFFAQACQLGLEGIISKHARRAYVPRRTKDWRKVKCLGREEAVVGGFSEPSGSRTGLGALLLGQYVDGALRYVGKVGTGFDTRTLGELHARLSTIEQKKPPFEGGPRGAEARRTHWVRPELVVEVSYSERTKDGKLRHPSFIGVREDKPAREVIPETPAPTRRSGQSTVAGVRLTNPEKILYPELGVTKRDLATYYESIAEHVVPHVADRPLTLVRCPDGLGKPCFYMQHAFEGMPSAIHAIDVEKGGNTLDHTMVRDLEGLVALVQFGALEVHTWCSRTKHLEEPDQLVFDLDPGPGVSWSGVIEGAFAVRAELEALGLASFVKTTGGKGLHVVVPIQPRDAWDDTKAFTRAVALALVRRDRRRYTASMAKSQRNRKIFVDYVRNSRGATAVAAYSTRARQGAPVSTPITWDELAKEPDPAAFNVRTVPGRLAGRPPEFPWEGFFTLRQSITRAMRARLGIPE